jgi:hypothetical protein
MNKALVLKASIVTFALAAVGYAASILGYFDITWLEVLIGFLGFSGLAGLRSYFDATGWKTYGVVVMAALGIVGFLTGIVSPEQLGEWFGFWGIVGASTLSHTVKKQLKK